MSHTPGPWFTDGAEITPEGSACLIARMQGSQGGGDRLANARLIAAAPDLLGACKAAMTPGLDTNAVEAMIIAAIEKATGEHHA